MAQRKWISELADKFEGGIDTDKALLDIKRGLMNNLFHESIGMWNSATIKDVHLLDSLSGIAVLAIDRVRHLTWKDYRPIAKGEEVIVPHTGNVDTLQVTINSMAYLSYEFPETDLTRLKNEPLYRASLTASINRTLAATIDAEVLELQIAAASGQKGHTIEMEIPRYPNPIENNLFTKFSYLGNEIEQTMNAYYIGIPRDEIVMTVSPDTHTQLIRTITPGNIMSDKVLGWIQDNSFSPSRIAGLTLIRHIFLGTVVPREVTNDFQENYDFTGIKAIINHRSSVWIQIVFNAINGVINKDTGNYRMIQRIVWGKGLVYGDLIKIIKEPSTKNNPLPYEEALIKNRDIYNSDKYGFEDWNIVIPETKEELQKNYRSMEPEINLPAPDAPDVDHSPEGWEQVTFRNRVIIWNSAKDALVIRDIGSRPNSYIYHAGEQWANDKNGITDHNNWYQFTEQFKDKKDTPIRFEKIILWTTRSLGYYYGVPVGWVTPEEIKKITPKKKKN